MSERTARKIGDRIRFRVMPWCFPNAKIHDGVITKVVDPEGDTYYHVDAMIGSEYVEGGMVFEREVVQEEQ